MSKEYTVTGKYYAFQSGTFVADTPEEALEAWYEEFGGQVSLCWECSREADTSDVVEIEVCLGDKVVLVEGDQCVREGNWTLKPEDLRWVDESPKSGMIVGDMSPKVVVEHIPTGLIVSVSRHRSQYKNRDEALLILEKIIKEIEYV